MKLVEFVANCALEFFPQKSKHFCDSFQAHWRGLSDHLKRFPSDNTIHIFISKVKCQWVFKEFSEFRVKIRPFKLFQNTLNTIFLLLRLPTDFVSIQSLKILWWFSVVFSLKNESKTTQNVLEMSNYCVSQDKIVDVWNVVLPIIIQIILHFLDFQPSVHTYLLLNRIIFVWYLKTWYIMILKRKIYNGITR